MSIGAYGLINWQHVDVTISFFLIFYGLFFAFLIFCIPIWIATKCKTVILDEKGIKIVFPFLQRKLYYFYTEIDYFETHKYYYNWFDFMEMKITLKNKRAIIITSGANTKFEEMNIFLQQRIEKK